MSKTNYNCHICHQFYDSKYKSMKEFKDKRIEFFVFMIEKVIREEYNKGITEYYYRLLTEIKEHDGFCFKKP